MEIVLKKENLTPEELINKTKEFLEMEITEENVINLLKNLNHGDKNNIIRYFELVKLSEGLTEKFRENLIIIKNVLKKIDLKKVELFQNAITYNNSDLFLTTLNLEEKESFIKSIKTLLANNEVSDCGYMIGILERSIVSCEKEHQKQLKSN